METEFLEREDPEKATPTTEVESAETEKQPEVADETTTEEQSEGTPKEAEVEIDGQRYTVTRVKEWQEAAKNKDQWQKSNTLKAQEIAAKRKTLEEAEAIYNVLKQNPEKLQKIFAPEPERDFDKETQAHYSRRPLEYGDEYVRWEQERDRLITEKATSQAFRLAQSQETQRSAKEHNESLANTAYDKYHEKVTDEEYQQMAGWLVNNLQPKNGKYPVEAFDVAYKVLYGDKDVESAKLSGAKALSDQIRKAKPASGEPGKLKQPETKTTSDEEDDKFLEEIRARTRK